MSLGLGTVLVGQAPDRGSPGDLESFTRALKRRHEALREARQQATSVLSAMQTMQSVAVDKSLTILDSVGADATEVLAAWCVECSRVLQRYCSERERLEQRAKRVRNKVDVGLREQRGLRRAFDAMTASESGGRIPVPSGWNHRIGLGGLVDEAIATSKRWNSTVDELCGFRRQYEQLQDDRERIDRQLARRIPQVPAAMSAVHAVGAQAALSLDSITPFTGAERIDRLAHAIAALQKAGATADIVAYWANFDGAIRKLLADRHPVLIGGLDGADARSRSCANLTKLTMWVNDPKTSMMAREDLKNLQKIFSEPHDPPRTLLQLELVDDGAQRSGGAITRTQRTVAAIGIGDVDDANRLVWAVFGMNSTAGKPTSGVRGLENLVTSASERDGTQKYGGIAWWGYDSPTSIEEPFKAHAELGGAHLARDLDRFVEGRSNPPKISLLGHSYGSYTSVEGLRRMDHRESIHTFISLGSPGLPRDTATVLDKTPGYAANARGDRVADLGQYMSNATRLAPVSADDQLLPWGAWGGTEQPWVVEGVNVMSAEESRSGTATTSHSLLPKEEVGYLTRGSTSLDAVTSVLTRQHD